MELGILNVSNLRPTIAIVLTCWLIISCSTLKNLDGIYQSFNNDGYGYTLGTLVLRKDSSYLIHTYHEQHDYNLRFGDCGNWSLKNDSIYLISFDTVPYRVEYLADTAKLFKLELFDSYDCQFMVPVLVLSPENRMMSEVKFGSFMKNLPVSFQTIKLVPTNNLQPHSIEIKRDSMHVKVHGLYIDGDKKGRYLKAVFMQKGRNLVSFCTPKENRIGDCRKTMYFRKSYLDPTYVATND